MSWVLTATYTYLVTGVVVLGVLMFRGKLKQRRTANSLPYRTSKSRGWKSWLENLLLSPLAVALFFVPAWPLILCIELNLPMHKLKFWESRDEKQMAADIASAPEPVFSVRKEDLVEQVTIEQIESAEVVFDPMQAVPAIPFGHLNQVWESFKKDLGPDSEVWSFSRQWVTRYRIELVKGYVVVNSGTIEQHVVTYEKWMNN